MMTILTALLECVATFSLFAGVTGCGTAVALYLAFRLDGTQERLAFDLVRGIGLTLGGWFTVALATLLDPYRLGAGVFVPPSVMAVGTLLCFLFAAVGWTCFLVFQWQALCGHHPWQRDVKGKSHG